MENTAKIKTLPKWMLKPSKSDKNSPKSSASGNQTSYDLNSPAKIKRLRKTVYCLSEKELLDAAKDVLKQAGKEDLLEEIKPHKDKELIMNKKTKLSKKHIDIVNSSCIPNKEAKNSCAPNCDQVSVEDCKLKAVTNKHKEPDLRPQKQKPDLSVLDEIFL